jgi:serine/threonine protein kinase
MTFDKQLTKQEIIHGRSREAWLQKIDDIVETADRTFNTAEGVTIVSSSKDYIVRFAKRTHAEKRRQRYDTMLSIPPVFCHAGMVVYEYIGPDVVEIYNMCTTDDEKLALAVKLAQDMYGAVRCLHERMIVHLDIKPDNICIDSRGKCILIDGGGATTIDCNGTSTDPCFYTMAACKPCVWSDHTVKDLREHDYYALAETILSIIPAEGTNEQVQTLTELVDSLTSLSHRNCGRLVATLSLQFMTPSAP